MAKGWRPAPSAPPRDRPDRHGQRARRGERHGGCPDGRQRGVDVYYIGTLEAEGVTTVKVADEDEGHKKMEEMVEKGEVDGAVTMHFPFPIGVSTVGRVVTPGKGKEMFIATTTGTFQPTASRA